MGTMQNQERTTSVLIPAPVQFQASRTVKVFVTKAGKIIGGQFVKTIVSAPVKSKEVYQQPTLTTQPTLTPTVTDQQVSVASMNSRSLSPAVPSETTGTSHTHTHTPQRPLVLK